MTEKQLTKVVIKKLKWLRHIMSVNDWDIYFAFVEPTRGMRKHNSRAEMHVESIHREAVIELNKWYWFTLEEDVEQNVQDCLAHEMAHLWDYVEFKDDGDKQEYICNMVARMIKLIQKDLAN